VQFSNILNILNCQMIVLNINCCNGLQYGVKISLITSFKDTCFIEIVPKQHKSKRGHSHVFYSSRVTWHDNLVEPLFATCWYISDEQTLCNDMASDVS
jgi:hypothetical protein